MNKSNLFFLTLFFCILNFLDSHARCTGSPNCTTCTNCSRCIHCSKEGGSCGACSGGGRKSNISRQSSNGFYDANRNDGKTTQYSKGKKKHKAQRQEHSSQNDSVIKVESTIETSDTNNDEDIIGWKIAFFILLGWVLFNWYRKRNNMPLLK